MPYRGWVRRLVSSPSLVSSSRPSVSRSSRPTGNTRGSVGHQLDDGRATLGILRRGDDPGRLVQQVVDEAGLHPDVVAVDLDQVVLGVDRGAPGWPPRR